MKKIKISILLSTYNEEKFIKKTIKEIFKHIKNSEIIIVDDNSTDNTIKIIKNLKFKNLKLYVRKNRGLASAFLLALINSSGDKIGWVDSNMNTLIKKFPLMIKKLNQNDIVLLSRYIKSGGDKRSSLRVLSSKLINLFSRIILSNKIKDYTSSIFVMNRNALEKTIPIAYGHGEFFIEFLYKGLKNNLKILEMPYIQPADYESISKTAPNVLRFFKLGFLYFFRILIIKFRSN